MSFDLQLKDLVEKRMRFVNENRERLVEAFLAETGMLPSECIMCQQDTYQDGQMVMKIWFERKDPYKAEPK
jgi:hypothetical protein